VGCQRRHQSRDEEPEPGARDQAADAGEFGDVDKAVAEVASARHTSAGLQQVTETNEIDNGKRGENGEASQQAQQAKQPLQGKAKTVPQADWPAFWTLAGRPLIDVCL